jgi:hypothetical protein
MAKFKISPELEERRKEAIEELETFLEDNETFEDFEAAHKAGTPGFHEVLVALRIAMETFGTHVYEHPAAVLDPEFYARADKLLEDMSELAADMTERHLEAAQQS